MPRQRLGFEVIHGHDVCTILQDDHSGCEQNCGAVRVSLRSGLVRTLELTVNPEHAALLLQRAMSQGFDSEIEAWVRHALRLWWETRGSIPVNRALGLPSTPARASLLIRDTWLREAGKHDRQRLLDFLNKHAAKMPRTFLRYAIEHLDQKTRDYYLGLRKTEK